MCNAFTMCIAHCAKPILWTKPERTATDAYGRLRTMGLWRSVGHVLRKRHSTWLTGGQAQRIAQSRYRGQRNRTYRTYRTYKTGSLGAVYAMRSENSGAHGCQRAKDLSVKSVFVRTGPFYPAPTMCIAQCTPSNTQGIQWAMCFLNAAVHGCQSAIETCP